MKGLRGGTGLADGGEGRHGDFAEIEGERLLALDLLLVFVLCKKTLRKTIK
jgi:hypothetical protein